jgi:hypothetical protein
MSSGVQAAVVQMDDERVMPYVEGYAGGVALTRPGTCALDAVVSHGRPPVE